MESAPDLFDRELDPLPLRRVGGDRDTVVPYQRLVVNPFLAVLVFIIIVWLAVEALQSRTSALFQLSMVLLLADFFLVQYHCLDCGATGWLVRYRRHACPSVMARWERAEWRRFHGPGVKLQLVAWFILVPTGLVLFLILRAAAQ